MARTRGAGTHRPRSHTPQVPRPRTPRDPRPPRPPRPPTTHRDSVPSVPRVEPRPSTPRVDPGPSSPRIDPGPSTPRVDPGPSTSPVDHLARLSADLRVRVERVIESLQARVGRGDVITLRRTDLESVVGLVANALLDRALTASSQPESSSRGTRSTLDVIGHGRRRRPSRSPDRERARRRRGRSRDPRDRREGHAHIDIDLSDIGTAKSDSRKVVTGIVAKLCDLHTRDHEIIRDLPATTCHDLFWAKIENPSKIDGGRHSDPNFTVSSLARCLRDLEQVPDNGDHTGDLSRTTSNQSLFTCLLDQTAFKATLGREGAVDSTYFELHGSGSASTVATDTQPTTFTKLPRAFMLQMDNSAKDNKNIHVLAFCSELVKHEIWESEAMHLVPLLLEKVADYKSYVGGFLDKLEGHSQPIGFRFSMANNVPIYKFQSKVDGPWVPEGGHSLWKKRNGFMTDAQYEDGLRVEQDEPALDKLERELQAENEMQLQPYVGPPSLCPKRAFVPLEDIGEGKFVVLRPKDDFEAEVPRAV
ncbi:hypothetical protein R1sor_021969 [Riccia sorocarpa]|uniref:DUF7869 domain-containing protein n=1 Tax=Riccia sorocarpa TaxID=122646 RepID=A0ABD3GJ89_9MARC